MLLVIFEFYRGVLKTKLRIKCSAIGASDLSKSGNSWIHGIGTNSINKEKNPLVACITIEKGLCFAWVVSLVNSLGLE